MAFYGKMIKIAKCSVNSWEVKMLLLKMGTILFLLAF